MQVGAAKVAEAALEMEHALAKCNGPELTSAQPAYDVLKEEYKSFLKTFAEYIKGP